MFHDCFLIYLINWLSEFLYQCVLFAALCEIVSKRVHIYLMHRSILDVTLYSYMYIYNVANRVWFSTENTGKLRCYALQYAETVI